MNLLLRLNIKFIQEIFLEEIKMNAKSSSITPFKKTNKQILIGTVLSYILLFFDLVVALFLPKWINNVIGQDNYGIYTLSNSLVSLFLIDFGLGAASTKFLTKIVIEGDKKKEKELLGIIYKIYLFIDIFIFSTYIVLFFLIDKIYVGLLPSQIKTLKIIFPILALFNVINFPFLALDGSFVSHEQFAFFKAFSLIQKIAYTALISVFLYFKFDVIYISLASVVSGFAVLLFKIIFCFFKCNFKPRLKYWDKEMAKKVFSFSVWITISIISSKLVASLLPSILGIVSNSKNVAVYGYAYALECNAFSLTTVVSSMMLPKLTRNARERDDGAKNESLAIGVGKIQAFIIGLFFSGFVAFGKDFLLLMMGESYLDSYYCFILLFVPNVIAGSVAVCERLAHVKDTIKYIAIIQIISAGFTIGLSFLLGIYFGAIGVSASYSIIQTIAILIIIILVYQKKQGMRMGRIIFKIMFPIIFPSLIPLITAFVLKNFVNITSWHIFVLFVLSFTLIYATIFFLFSISKKEKSIIKSFFKSNSSRDYIFRFQRYNLGVSDIDCFTIN